MEWLERMLGELQHGPADEDSAVCQRHVSRGLKAAPEVQFVQLLRYIFQLFTLSITYIMEA